MSHRATPLHRSLPLALAVMAAATAEATDHDVLVSGTSFSPADLKIEVGDTVRWEWGTGIHNVESGVNGTHDGNFTSGAPVNSPGFVYQLTFDQAFLDANPMPDNVYPYYCVLHVAFGMEGTVTVNEPCADVTGDGTVNVFDLTAIIQAWGSSDPDADVNGDGTVDVFDLTAVIAGWGDC